MRGRMTSWPGRSFALKLLAILEIGGALYGIYYTFLAIPEMRPLTPLRVLVFAAVTLLYLLSLVAGLLLSRELPLGVRISVILQWLQVVRVSTPGLGYMFYSGACLFFGVSEGAPGFTFALGSGWHFHLSEAGAPVSIALNVIPIAALILLQRARVGAPAGATIRVHE